MNEGMRLKTFLFFSIIILAGGLMFSFQRWQANAQLSVLSVSEKPSLTQSLFSKGKALYEKQCISCHGKWGAGDGKAAYLLYPKPRNFTRREFRLISTTDMTVRDSDLFKTITRGMPGSAMPPWEFLPEEDRWGLVFYVRYLTELGKKTGGQITDDKIQRGLSWEEKKQLATEQIDPEAIIKISEEPSVTQEGIARGRNLFVKGCAACHGLEGKGDGRQMMMDSLGFPLKPRDLTAGIFKASGSSEELYYRMIAGLPGTPMPSYQYAFKPEEIWDMIHYVQTLPEDGKMDKALMSRHFVKAQKVGDGDFGPGASGWDLVPGQEINLMPLWWRNDRVESVEVKAVHDRTNLYLELSWMDQTKDDQAGAVTDFSDGASVQFSQDADPPLFAMGSENQTVSFWHWKAAWENAVDPEEMIEKRYPNYAHATPPKELYHQFLSGQDAGNPVSNLDPKWGAEEGQAKGIGSYTALKIQPEAVEAKSLWKDERWYVVFKRELKVKDSERIEFNQGETINIAFAVWDGSKQDRNGQKLISIWNELTVE